jgi:hypothetical protein
MLLTTVPKFACRLIRKSALIFRAKDCSGKPTVPNFSGRGLAMESLLERPKEKAVYLATIREEVLKNLTIFTPNES